MQKRLNRFSLVLWAFAALFLLADVPMTIGMKQWIMTTHYPGGLSEASAISWMNIWNETRAALSGALQLSALGVLIEIADRIRWDALHRRDEMPPTVKL